MNPHTTALILIGYQNDYFASNGILHGVIEESSRITGTLHHTLELLEAVDSTPVLVITTPIHFTPDYSELSEPVGILKTISEVGAFKAGTDGAATIPELNQYADRIVEVPGKRGLNAFSNTNLDDVLREHGITDVVLAGAVTSICIDSTGRAASERGYRVAILADCTSSRTPFEQEFYCSQVFPLYAQVLTRTALIEQLELVPA